LKQNFKFFFFKFILNLKLKLFFKDLSISLEKPKSTDIAHKEENISMNRFSAAVPFNFNRVILQHIIGYDNTYINASLIKVFFITLFYIY
jgi:protein tyrosine phosphatase